MEVIEFLTIMSRICRSNDCTDECPLKFSCKTSYDNLTKETIEKTAKAAEEWAAEHPIKTRLSEYKKVFPDARLRSNGYPVVDPCTISISYDKKCSEMINCSKCRKEYWSKEVE